jgi:hypothetical protein
VQVEPILYKNHVESPWNEALETAIRCNLLSIFASNFNLRRYVSALNSMTLDFEEIRETSPSVTEFKEVSGLGCWDAEDVLIVRKCCHISHSHSHSHSYSYSSSHSFSFTFALSFALSCSRSMYTLFHIFLESSSVRYFCNRDNVKRHAGDRAKA